MIPVSPPNTKVTRKPMAQSIGVSNDREPFHMVPIQLKNLTPVGTPMRRDIIEKNGRRTEPVANMWCAQTVIESPAITMVAPIRPI